jgi:hypothetical protein
MRFWKEKSVEDTVTLGPTARATLVLFITKDRTVHNRHYGLKYCTHKMHTNSVCLVFKETGTFYYNYSTALMPFGSLIWCRVGKLVGDSTLKNTEELSDLSRPLLPLASKDELESSSGCT